MSKPDVSAAGGHHRIAWGEPEYVTVEFDLLRSERSGELTGEVTIWATPEGLSNQLHRARMNLSSTRSRAEVAKHVQSRSNGHQPDWLGAIEYACIRTIDAYRAGDPAVALSDIERPAGDGFILPPLALGRMPSCLFGDGGSGKSLLALAAGISIQTGVPLLGLTPTTTTRVALLDWEMDGWEHRQRALALAGVESDMVYVRCQRPLTEDVDRIRRIIRQRSIGYLIVDSVALACDGAPEASDVALRFFQALGQLGVGALCVAHVNRSGDTDRPFGSTYWHNSFRSTWFVKKQQDVGVSGLTIGLFDKKENTGPKSAPLGYALDWSNGRIAITRTDVRDIPNLADHVSLRYRIAHELRAGARTVADLAETLDVPTNTVHKTLDRGEKSGEFLRVAGPDGIYRWRLAA